MKTVQVAGLSCFEIIQINWRSIKVSIQKHNQEIQLFMNQLFDVLPQLLSESTETFETLETRKEFEVKVNELINECFDKYSLFASEYNEGNIDMSNLDSNSLKGIIQEHSTPLDNNEFPYLDEFMYEFYPDVNNLMKFMEQDNRYEDKYPLIANYLSQKSTIDLLANIPLINPFTNYMMKKYSYNISRLDAKSTLIKNNLDEISKLMFESFTKGWNKIYHIATWHGCCHAMKPKLINDDSTLSYALVDDGEEYNGMCLVSAYNKLIEHQNNFIKLIIQKNKVKGISHDYVQSLKEQINIQDATQNEIVSFDIHTIDYNSFEDIVYAYSSKDCFNNEGEIDYKSYSKIHYDLPNIEKELSKILLPGKKLFSGKINNVTYAYEAYQGDNTTVLTEFNEKYPFIPIDSNQRRILDYLYKDNKNIIMQFLSFIQMIIYYLKCSIEKIDTPLYVSLSNLPVYIKLNNDFIVFFNQEENKTFVVGHLLEIYEYLENKCFDYFIDKTGNQYTEDINSDVIEKLNLYFAQPSLLITKDIFIRALKRFISRYLSGARLIVNMNLQEKLIVFMREKEEIWSNKVYNNKIFENECELLLHHNIKLNQSIKLATKLINQ